VVLVTVTLSTPAATPVAGTPPWPVICTVRLLPAPSGALGAPTPVRVSRMRAGASARYWPRPGVTLFDGADGVPGPLAFEAVTVKVQAVPSLSPLAVADLAV